MNEDEVLGQNILYCWIDCLEISPRVRETSGRHFQFQTAAQSTLLIYTLTIFNAPFLCFVPSHTFVLPGQPGSM